ncbi:MAG TPA: NADH-quinone oxidoreductase subunit J, partial [Casimicrobiaceae bacterium]|nr:NADH-quinone oxidoreductase subunit J [Casimicrobiaceae bacterium]
MTFPTFTFYAFAAILIFAAVRVITTRNPVHAALWLVLSFFTAAGIWLLLQAEFLAIALVLIYVGAVMVLFLFVVMMLDVNFEILRQHFRSYLPIAAAVGILVLFEMALVIVDSAIGRTTTAAPAPTGSNTRALGDLLYVDYVYPF